MNPAPTTSISAPSSEAFRAQFPSLTDLVHLASCSQGAPSTRVIAALQEFQWSLHSHGAPWERWMGQVEAARRAFAELIGASPDEVAVLSCASQGAFQVASTIDWDRRPGIVTTDMEFPSIAHVWLAQGRRGAKTRHVPEHGGVVHAADYLAAIDETAGLVSVPLVSYRNGLRLPVREAIAAARKAGARVFVDAYQAAGVMPVDVRALGCDYLVAGTLKYLLGVPGLAFLYARGGLPDHFEPEYTGWFGRVDPFSFDPRSLDFPATARRFEAGTPAIPSAYAAHAALTTLAEVDATTIEAHVRELVAQAHDRLTGDGEQVWSPADPDLRGAQVAIVDSDPDALAGHLAARHIITSPRGHVLRLSFHYYNDASDIEAFCTALREYRATRGR